MVTHQSLTALHQQHGLSRMGNARALVRHPARMLDSAVDPKTHKTASEMEMIALIPGILAKEVAEHPPYGLQHIVDNEAFGILPVTRDGLARSVYMTPRQTQLLQNECLTDRTIEGSVQRIAAYTQRSIAGLMYTAYKQWKFSRCAEEVELHEQRTAFCNHPIGLPGNPTENLLVATGNSNNVMWRMLQVVPEVFHRDVGYTPSVEEATTVAANSVRTLELLASCHFHVFITINERLHQSVRSMHRLRSFHPGWLTLRRDRENVFVALNASLLQALNIGQTGSRTRNMCAALLAEVDGKSVIAHVYERNVQLARDMVYPAHCA